MGRQAAAGGAHWLDAELHRVEGELLQVGPLADLARTEAHFLEALAVARAQASRTLELRTATSLARLWQSQGRAGEARALLAAGRGVVHRGARYHRSAGGPRISCA